MIRKSLEACDEEAAEGVGTGRAGAEDIAMLCQLKKCNLLILPM